MTRPRPPYTLDDLPALTGRSYDWLARKANREKLYRVGFPRPLPGPGIPRWPADRVDHWCRGGCAPAPVNAPANPPVNAPAQTNDNVPAQADAPPVTESVEAQRARLMKVLGA